MECKRIEKQEFFWALQGVCTLHRTPWSTDLAHQQLAAPHTLASLCQAAEQFGFSASINKVKPANIPHESFPLIACLSARAGSPYDDVTLVSDNLNPDEFVSLGLVLQADREHVLLAEPGNPTPLTITSAEFARRYLGTVVRLAPRSEGADDAGDCGQSRPQRRFSFQWFIPELLKHKKLWQEILLASLVIQIIALTTPLFTQAIIDKVVVHHTQSTLIVIAVGMVAFTLFAGCLTWLRQYLVLHTGIRDGQVLNSVSTTKTIYSYEIRPSVFKFVNFKDLLEIEAGMTRNEPAQLCVREAIEAAVVHLTVIGVRDRVWALKNPDDWNAPVMQSVLRENENLLKGRQAIF